MYDKNAIDESKMSPKGRAQLARLREEMRKIYASLPKATLEEVLAQAEGSRRQRGLPPLNVSDRNDDSKAT